MAKPRVGGNATPTTDGGVHWSLYYNDGDGGKGHRVSWNQNPGQTNADVHTTGQNTGEHSTFSQRGVHKK